MSNFTQLLSNYDKVWIWSDTHFFHKNIIKYCNRPFDTVGEMNYYLQKMWQDVVGKNDLIINCGDFTFGETEDGNRIIRNSPGYSVLIVGNHDYRKKKIRDLKFDMLSAKEEFEYEGHNFLLTHVPVKVANLNNRFNIHGHIHDKHYVENYDTPQAFESPYHACVSVEHTGYKPILLSDVCNKLIARNGDIFKSNTV